MKAILLLLAISLQMSFLVPGRARAQLIDFETQPNGSAASDNLALSRAEPYVVGDVQIRLGFDTNGDGMADSDARFEAVGDDVDNSFAGTSGTDTADPGFEGLLGAFFLRGAETTGAPPGTLIISYDPAGSTGMAASGEIWDIDGNTFGTEQWRIRAFDTGGSLIADVDTPLGIEEGPDSLDGRPFTFGFSGLESGIAQLEISFIGSKTTTVGVAFNNFDPTTNRAPSLVPTPGSLAPLLMVVLTVSGLLGLVRLRAVPTRSGGSKAH